MEDSEPVKDSEGVVQFFRDYWILVNIERRRIFQAAGIITFMQALAIVEPSMITSMVQDALRHGMASKRIIAWKMAIAFLILVVQALVQWGKSVLVRRLALSIEHRLMVEFLDKLLRLGGVFHETTNVGQLQGTIMRGVSKVTEITFLLAQDLLPLLVMFVLTVVAVAWYSPVCALLVVSVFVVFLLVTIVTRAMMMKGRQARQKLRRSVDKLFGSIVACVRTVWIFGQEEREIARLVRIQHRITEMFEVEATLYDKSDFWRGILIGFGRLGVVEICLLQALRDPSTVTNMFLILMLTERLFKMSYSIGGIFDRAVEGMKPVEELLSVLAEKVLIKDPDHAIDLPTVRYGIVYQNACYAYPTRPDRKALNDIQLTITAGQTIGLVGGSGGGKSTLVKALLRFVDLDQGQILIDGIDIRNLKIRTLRRLMGCVSQDVEIFDGTVAMNIGYGKPEATREEIEAVAKLANIHDRIMSFPKGYDALVGNEGQQLSGGERQRIAIARVLLVDPSVIVFDEATSAVDPESDMAIHEAVERLAQMGKTIIIIAHRLGTVRGADHIYCLDDGRVVESGTHDQLLLRQGRYYALWTAHERGSRGRGHVAADSAN